MQSSLIVAALLCFTTRMSSVRATPISIRSCCVVWSKTRVPLDRIVNYAIQTKDICRIKAVHLRTVLGKTICANPCADWTRKAIEKVDKEKSQKGFACDTTPTGSTPATSTSTTSTASPNLKSYGPVKSCCFSWSKTEIPLRQIVNYAIQSEENCRIKAVQLRTVGGKTICANPNADWTKEAIKKVDDEKEKLALAASAPTTSTPTTSTPATSAPTTSTPATSKSASTPEASSLSTSTPTTSTPATSTAPPTSEKIPQKNVTLGEDTQEGGTKKDKETGQSLTMLCQIHCCVVPWNKNMLCPTN